MKNAVNLLILSTLLYCAPSFADTSEKTLAECDAVTTSSSVLPSANPHISITEQKYTANDGTPWDTISFDITQDPATRTIVAGSLPESIAANIREMIQVSEDASFSENDPRYSEASFDSTPGAQKLTVKIWDGIGAKWKHAVGLSPNETLEASCIKPVTAQ